MPDRNEAGEPQPGSTGLYSTVSPAKQPSGTALGLLHVASFLTWCESAAGLALPGASGEHAASPAPRQGSSSFSGLQAASGLVLLQLWSRRGEL